MDKVVKKGFCIIAVQNLEGIKDNVISMSTGLHRVIEDNSMLVITFEGYMTPEEMKMVIDETDGRTYFLFELNKNTAAVNINKKSVNDYLFGSILPTNPLDVTSTKFGSMGINNLDSKFVKDSKELYERIIRNDIKIAEIIASVRTKGHNKDSDYNEEELKSFTKEQQSDLLDELLDKAPNLTEIDKKILDFLVNKNN